MEAITAKKQADAERAEMNRQAEEAAENARIWPIPPGQRPVEPLGWNGDRMFFWSHAYRRIIQLQQMKRSYGEMVRLAPVRDFASWLNHDPDDEKGVINTAARRLEDESAPLTYREEDILGRGVWYADREKKEIIYSAGKRCYMLTASGEFKELNTCVWRGKIYTSDKKNTLPAAEPLTDAEGQRLIALMSLRPWQTYRAGEMVAGWMVCAMLCGLLTARPQLWINAPAGTGKSTLRDDIATAFGGIDGGFVCSVDGGSTTEAGMRRTLDREAVPVLFDEAEANRDTRSAQNIASILDTIRTVATAKDPAITQSAANGGTVIFRPRFCSALFSVNNALVQDTDVSRFFILRLNGKAKQAEKERMYAKQEPPRALIRQKDFTPRLLRRVLESARDIIRNAHSLAEVMKKKLSAAGCRTADRSADMLAHIMAGAYALTHHGAMSKGEMDAYAADAVRVDEDRNNEIERQSETELALETLLTHTLQLPGKGGFTVARLCRIVEESQEAELTALAGSALETCGLRWRHDREGKSWLAFHTSYKGAKEIYAKSSIPRNKVRSILLRDDDGLGIKELQARLATCGNAPNKVPHIPGEYVLNRTEE